MTRWRTAAGSPSALPTAASAARARASATCRPGDYVSLWVADTGAGVDLLVTDIGLPGGLDGRQVARLARSRRPGL